MSFGPWPPGRSLEKNSRCPSGERTGDASRPALFTFGPRFTGCSHGLSGEARRETQMSTPPRPPARPETKYRLSSSGDSDAFMSLTDELMGAPRFTGSDHSELPKRSAWSAETTRSGVVPHAASSTSGVNETRMRHVVVIG